MYYVCTSGIIINQTAIGAGVETRSKKLGEEGDEGHWEVAEGVKAE
jgi:hypothetical protein